MSASFKNIGTATICPVSGLPVKTRPGWTDCRFGRGFRITVRVIGSRILQVIPSGHAYAEGVRRGLEMTDAIIRDDIDGSNGFVQLMDYSSLSGISRNARLRYIRHIKQRKNLLALIYYNVSPLFRVMIKLASRLSPKTVRVRIAKHYEAAIQMALAFLEDEPVDIEPAIQKALSFLDIEPVAFEPKPPAIDYAALGITEHYEGGRHILRCDRWHLSLDDYSATMEVIDGSIYHARSFGILREQHIETISRIRERVRDTLKLENGFSAIVTATADNHMVDRRARKKYMASLKKWHEQYPIALYIFYNANWFIRGSAMLAIPFMPFPVKVTHDFSGAMAIINRFVDAVPTDTPKASSPESEAEDPQHVVHQLLQFIGDIDWDRRGAAEPNQVPPDHPFCPVFDAVALVKGELDEIFEEHRLAELRLIETQRRFDEVLKLSRDILYKYDLKTGAVDYISDVVEELFEMTPEAVRRVGIDGFKHLVIHPEDLHRVEEFVERLMNTDALPQGEHTIEYRLQSRQGDYRWFNDSMAIVLDDGGEPAYIIGNSRDISRIKELEAERLKIAEELQHTRKLEAVRTMAGGVAHNFNNLLMVVLGNLEIMRMETSADSRLHRNISMAEKSAQRAAELGKLMLTYLGQGQMNPQDFDLHAIVSEIANVLIETFAERATLVLAPAKNTTWINADPANVYQVVSNLVTNAVEASTEDRPPIVQLTVGSRFCDSSELSQLATGGEKLSPGHYSWLKVSDSGGGMDKDILDKIFDPFFTTKFTGRGLGMATVMGVMRAHKGGVHVDSWKGKGTTVIVYFPQVQPMEGQAWEEPEKAKATDPRNRGTVLLADEEPLVLELGAQMLELLGFEVLTSGNEEEALAQFLGQRDRIRLALFDINILQVDGSKILSRFRQTGATFPVMVASAYTDSQAREILGSLSIDAFIQKPYRVDRLNEKIHRLFNVKS